MTTKITNVSLDADSGAVQATITMIRSAHGLISAATVLPASELPEDFRATLISWLCGGPVIPVAQLIAMYDSTEDSGTHRRDEEVSAAVARLVAAHRPEGAQ